MGQRQIVNPAASWKLIFSGPAQGELVPDNHVGLEFVDSHGQGDLASVRCRPPHCRGPNRTKKWRSNRRVTMRCD